MNNLDERVDIMINKEEKWQEEYKVLREIILSCGLEEDYKWGQPTYNFEDTSVMLIHSFKEYIAIMYFKGSLMKDNEKLLIQQTENVTGRRQIRFKNSDEINKLKDIIRDYTFEAIEIEREGLKVDFSANKEIEIIDELQEIFDKMPEVEKAFNVLTPGRKKGYMLFFSSAKQSKTRTSRIEKNIDKILDGKGYMDK